MNPETYAGGPKVAYEKDAFDTYVVDPKAAANTLENLGVSRQTIDETSIYLSGSCLVSYGRTLPLGLAGYRYARSRSELLRNPNGTVIRVSSRRLGHDMPLDQINSVLAHELVHVKQIEDHPKAITAGLLAALSAAALSGAAISKLTKNSNFLARMLAIAGGAYGGQQLSYRLIFGHLERAANQFANENALSIVSERNAFAQPSEQGLEQPAAA